MQTDTADIRNQFKSLLRMIHASGKGSHHEMQKHKVGNALEALDGKADDFDAVDSGPTRTEIIMSVDTAFHCVPLERLEKGNEGDASLCKVVEGLIDT